MFSNQARGQKELRLSRALPSPDTNPCLSHLLTHAPSLGPIAEILRPSPYVWDLHTATSIRTSEASSHHCVQTLCHNTAVWQGARSERLPVSNSMNRTLVLRMSTAGQVNAGLCGERSGFSLHARLIGVAALMRHGWDRPSMKRERMQAFFLVSIRCYGPSYTAPHCPCQMYAQKIKQFQPGIACKVRRKVRMLEVFEERSRPLPKVECFFPVWKEASKPRSTLQWNTDEPIWCG